MRKLLYDLFILGLVVVVVWIMADAACAQCGPSGCPSTPGGWGAPSGPSFGPSAPRYESQSAPSQWFGANDQRLYPFMCKVEVGRAGGSGVLVEVAGKTHSVILTAGHVVTGGGTPKCMFPNGSTYTGMVIAIDREADIAAIQTELVRGIPPVRLATKDASPGERATLIGYGGSPRKGFLARGGFIKSFGQSRAVIAGASSHGDSGGAVIDARGQLIGVISATDQSYSQATYVALYGPLRRLLGMPPRYEYQRKHNLPPNFGTQQGPPGNYVPPMLPDTANLITREEYEADKGKLIEVLQRADLLERTVNDVATQAERAETQAVQASTKADAVSGEAKAVAAEVTESKGLLERVKERLGGLEGSIVKIDGKIAGVVDTEDFLSLAGQFRDTRAELVTENMTFRERLHADLEAAKQTISANKDGIKAEVLEAAESKFPKIPWGLLTTAIAVATGGAGLGATGLITALMRRGGGAVAGSDVVQGIAARMEDSNSRIVSTLGSLIDRLDGVDRPAAKKR